MFRGNSSFLLVFFLLWRSIYSRKFRAHLWFSSLFNSESICKKQYVEAIYIVKVYCLMEFAFALIGVIFVIQYFAQILYGCEIAIA